MSYELPVMATLKQIAPTVAITSIAGAAAMDGHFWARIIAVVVGLVLGAVWRAGSFRSEGKNWDTVWSDLIVSGLIGGANAVIAIIIVDYFGASVLISMGIGVLVGATGVRAVQEAREIFINFVKKMFDGK